VPDYRDYTVEVDRPATIRRESTRQLGQMLRHIYVRNRELPPLLS
jgi:xylulose-5-phosphate/fructose-6-phosphate phosphoketolase